MTFYRLRSQKTNSICGYCLYLSPFWGAIALTFGESPFWGLYHWPSRWLINTPDNREDS